MDETTQGGAPPQASAPVEPAATPVAAPAAEPVVSSNTLAEPSTPEPSSAPTLNDEAVHAYIREKGWGHDQFKTYDGYNAVVKQAINRGLKEQTQLVEAHQQHLQTLARIEGLIHQTPDADLKAAILAGTQYGPDGQPNPQGLTIGQWTDAIAKAKTAPVSQQMATAYGMQAAAKVKGLLAEHPDFQHLANDLDTLIGNDGDVPAMLVRLAEQAVKAERAKVKAEIEAGISKGLARLHLSGDELAALPQGGESGGAAINDAILSGRIPRPVADLEAAYIRKWGVSPTG